MTDEGRNRNGRNKDAAEATDGEGFPERSGAPGAGEAVATGAKVRDASGRAHEDASVETAPGAAGNGDGGGGQPDSPRTEAHAGDLGEALAEARRAAEETLERALRAEDEALRARAEIENVRRRMARDVENAHKFALERFVSDLLPVRDSLEAGLDASAGKGASAASIAEGIELTLRMLAQAMEKSGVEVVDPAGQPFDPQLHQAMTVQESDTAESGTVLTVVQKGCLLNERLVRPAMVIVAK